MTIEEKCDEQECMLISRNVWRKSAPKKLFLAYEKRDERFGTRGLSWRVITVSILDPDQLNSIDRHELNSIDTNEYKYKILSIDDNGSLYPNSLLAE